MDVQKFERVPFPLLGRQFRRYSLDIIPARRISEVERNEVDFFGRITQVERTEIEFARTCRVTASCYRSLNALTEVEQPAGMGESLGTGAHRHRSILPPGVKYVPGPRVLRRILSNRS